MGHPKEGLFSPAGTLKTLRAAPGRITWANRRSIARKLGEVLGRGEQCESAAELAELLAQDEKWEVRKEVADFLVHLPEDGFVKIAAKLAVDDNAFVRKATERALERRGVKTSMNFQNEALNAVETEFTAIEREYGKLIAAKARSAAERMYDLLIGEVVHEIRGVLTPIKANTLSASEKLDQKGSKAVVKEKLGRVRDRVLFMERLINDMRAFSQTLGKARQPEELRGLAEEAKMLALERVQQSKPAAEKVAVVIEAPPKLTIKVARHQIVVALANIIKNGMEAASDRPNGRVLVRCELTEACVCITIEDNGPGRNREDLAMLRDFVPGRTTMKHYGTGFGLPIARKNVQAHGGTLEVDSPPGRGFVVRIALPVVGGEAQDEQ